MAVSGSEWILTGVGEASSVTLKRNRHLLTSEIGLIFNDYTTEQATGDSIIKLPGLIGAVARDMRPGIMTLTIHGFICGVAMDDSVSVDARTANIEAGLQTLHDMNGNAYNITTGPVVFPAEATGSLSVLNVSTGLYAGGLDKPFILQLGNLMGHI